MAVLEELAAALEGGRKKQVTSLISQALEEGFSAQEILNGGLLKGMSAVGEQFKNGEVFVPEVLIAARAMNAGTALLKPYLTQEGVEPIGKACIGTVQGDLHDIGKNLVRMMLEGKGIQVVDLGVDVAPERFVECAVAESCGLICCSSLLSITMPVMERVVEDAKRAGIRERVKIMVGGAPVTQEFCDSIGADAYTPDAATAAEVAASLLGAR